MNTNKIDMSLKEREFITFVVRSPNGLIVASAYQGLDGKTSLDVKYSSRIIVSCDSVDSDAIRYG